MLVFKKITSEKSVLSIKSSIGIFSHYIIWFRRKVEVYLNKFLSSNWPSQISIDLPIRSGMSKKINEMNIDIVHIHWVSFGMLTIEEISRIKFPILITTRDMFWMSGGCHYTHNCKNFGKNCVDCPAVPNYLKKQIAKNFQSKLKLIANNDIHIFSISTWLKNQSVQSPIFSHTKININPIDVNSEAFKIQNKVEAKRKIKIDFTKKVILFGSIRPFQDERKGWNRLEEACSSINSDIPYEVVVFGNEIVPKINLPFPVKCLGKININELAQIYSCADVFVALADQEGFGKTTVEALLCGTPVIGLRTGIVEDAIENDFNGYVLNDENELASKLKISLLREWNAESIRADAVRKFDNFAELNRYIEFYKTMANG